MDSKWKITWELLWQQSLLVPSPVTTVAAGCPETPQGLHTKNSSNSVDFPLVLPVSVIG